MKAVALFLSIFSLSSLLAQNFNITDEKSFGGSSWDVLRVIPDGSGTGYIFYGSSNSDGSLDHGSTNFGNGDIWLVRTDLNYNILWEQNYGGTGNDVCLDALIHNNHVYLAAISDSPVSGNKTVGSNGGNDVWMLKVDLSGSIIWQENYGGSDPEETVEIEVYQDQILMMCISQSSNSGDITTTNQGFSDCWMALIDSSTGVINDQVMFGSSSLEQMGGLQVYDNRIFAIVNSYGDDGDVPPMEPSFGLDIALFELNSDLDLVGTHGFYGNADDLGRQLIKKSANEYFLLAESQSSTSGVKSSDPFGFTDVWLIKLDANLTIIWDSIYGGSGFDYTSDFAHIDANGNLVLLCSSNSPQNSGNKTAANYGAHDLWPLIVNSGSGELIVDFTFGGDNDDNPTGLQPLGNGKLLITGATVSGISGNKSVSLKGTQDTWIVETDASNYLELIEESSDIAVLTYPNPAFDEVVFLLGTGNFESLTVCTVDGRILEHLALQNGTQSITIDLEGISESVVFYSLRGESGNSTGKILISR